MPSFSNTSFAINFYLYSRHLLRILGAQHIHMHGKEDTTKSAVSTHVWLKQKNNGIDKIRKCLHLEDRKTEKLRRKEDERRRKCQGYENFLVKSIYISSKRPFIELDSIAWCRQQGGEMTELKSKLTSWPTKITAII